MLEKSIPLSGVDGRIDHLAVDAKMHRLFVAALGNNTVEVIDLEKSERIQTLKGFEEPQGVCFVPELRKLFVACGGDGSCRIYDDALKLVKKVDLKFDADNLRYDTATAKVYAGHGDGAIAVIDPKTGEITADIALSAHPEAFEIDSAAGRIYANVPNSKQIEVIDLAKKSVVEKWKLKEAQSNFPMALDASARRLVIGCRSPSRILTLDSSEGKVIDAIACPGDIDDIFIFSKDGNVVAIGGESAMETFCRRPDDRLESLGRIATVHGARTGLFVPEMKRLYIAVPKEGEDARILVFRYGQ